MGLEIHGPKKVKLNSLPEFLDIKRLIFLVVSTRFELFLANPLGKCVRIWPESVCQVLVEAAEGVPSDAVLSLRLGNLRRQAPLSPGPQADAGVSCD